MRDKDIARENIRNHSLKEFLEKGYRKASMRSIAARCEIPLSSIYYYYKNKQAIFNDLIGMVLQDSMEILYKYQDGFISLFLSGDEELEKKLIIAMKKHLCKNRIGALLTLGKKCDGTKYEHRREELTSQVYTMFCDILKRCDPKIKISNEISLTCATYAAMTVEELYFVAKNYEEAEWVPMAMYQVFSFFIKEINSLANANKNL